MILKYSCKWCKNNMEFSFEMCGQWLACPHCNRQIRLPEADELRPIGQEKVWYDDDGNLTHIKCRKCRKMVAVTKGSDGGELFAKYGSHKMNDGFECELSYTKVGLIE